MDKLKDFIESNRAEFELTDMPEGHMDRFKQKMFGQQKKRRVTIRLVWSLGAAALLGLLLTIHVQFQQTDSYEVCELHTEIGELSAYYNMQITAVLSQMEELYKEKQSPGALELMKQTQEVLASNQDFEKNILPSLPCSESALFAMNQHYDASISGMHILLKQMHELIEDEK